MHSCSNIIIISLLRNSWVKISFPKLGSHIKFVLGHKLVSKALIIFLKISNEPSKPFSVTKSKLSLLVWYSKFF